MGRRRHHRPHHVRRHQVTVNLAHLDEPRVGNHRGFVILMGGAYSKYISPQTARELAAELVANADRAERTTT